MVLSQIDKSIEYPAVKFVDSEDLDYDAQLYQIELFPDLDSTNNEPKLLSEKLNNEHLGMKTNKGFYEWNEKSKDNYKEKIISGLTVIDKI